MSATPINSSKAPPVLGPYSHAVKTPTAIYCSGQIPADETGKVIGEKKDVEERTRQCLKNLQSVLQEAGSSIDKIVKVNVFLIDMGDFKAMNKVYEEVIKHKPARSCVAVKELPNGVSVEIECIALP